MPRNLSYKAKWVHLLSHIKYLTFKAGEDNRLVNAVASWLLAAHIEFIALAGRDPDRRLRCCTLPDLDRRRSGVGSHSGTVVRLGAPHPPRKPARMDVRWRGRLRKRLRLADKQSSRPTAAVVGPHPSRRPVRAGVCGQGCAVHHRRGVGRPHSGARRKAAALVRRSNQRRVTARAPGQAAKGMLSSRRPVIPSPHSSSAHGRTKLG